MMEINAITLVTADMAAAVRFWSVLDLEVVYGGPDGDFTSLRYGSNYVNLVRHDDADVPFWGRVVFHVTSPDDVWERFTKAGYPTMTKPADAPWRERYFHIKDPDGHELSFATPIEPDGA